jgi:hypothetical protein
MVYEAFHRPRPGSTYPEILRKAQLKVYEAFHRPMPGSTYLHL